MNGEKIIALVDAFQTATNGELEIDSIFTNGVTGLQTIEDEKGRYWVLDEKTHKIISFQNFCAK